VSLAGFTPRNLLLLLIVLAAAGCFYLDGLGEVGLLGPDEPRYASIGREMAWSGDWITPRLWGSAWFEKPPLLYWLIAAGHAAGLGVDLAPRIPVALFSIAFLAVQFWLLLRFYGEPIAWMTTLLLTTTAGWSAYSQVGVTDLPLAVTFSSALLFGALWLQDGRRPFVYAAAACLGMAVLAKGLVPLVLSLPLLWFARKRWREAVWPAALFLAVAAPWFVIMGAIHGWAFFDEFFVRHHLARFATGGLLHVQPFWFYFPVLLGGLFPWPVILSLLGPYCWRDVRFRLPAATFAFGLLFFSLSSNKLPGYVLPLLPQFCLLLAAGVEAAPSARRPLALTALLVGFCPAIVTVLPEALLHGLRRAQPGDVNWWSFALVLPLAAAVWWLDTRGRRVSALALVAALAAGGLWFVKKSATPALDQLVSARALWLRIEPHRNGVCVDSLHRNWRYGLNYYSVEPLPDCAQSPRAISVRQEPRGLPRIAPRIAPSSP
jgi:4-amino-4-deoxy-L-arabinose transferase-like glycosyltransferase